MVMNHAEVARAASDEMPTEPQIYETVLGAMGNTPLVRLHRVSSSVRAQMVAKVEYFNPGGSVKDRIGITIIEDAERRGLLKPGGTIVEATSGNTGVGLAIAAALRGYKCVFVLADKQSEEKRQTLRAYGARVVVTPTNVEPEDPRSYYSVAKRIVAETPNCILANQYHNPINPLTHYETTGPELWRQTAGKIDVFITGLGTGGTISGVGKYLKEQNPNVQVVGVDPIGSILYEYFYTGQMSEAHSYKVEGVGEDFVPSIYDFSVIDDVVKVTDKESFLMTRRLTREEGLFVGGSCGFAMAGALKYVAERDLGPDKLVVVLLPDGGARYLGKIFNDTWMRENQYLDNELVDVRVDSVVNRKVRQDMVLAHCDQTVGDVIAMMKSHDISQLPVTGEQGNLLGLVSEVGLLTYLLGGGTSTSVLRDSPVIDDAVPTIQMDTPIESVMAMFGKESQVALITERQHNSDHKRVTGILTKIDVLDFLASR